MIQPGFIKLPGYDAGFIGGSAVKLSKDILAFTGHLNAHPEKKQICNYIQARGITIEYLTEEPCFDVGSMIPIKEYI